MHTLFNPLPFNGKTLLWNHRRRSEQDFDGYYHWHQGCEMLFVYQGQGTIIVNRHTYPVKPGMLFFFQPFQLHRVNIAVSPEQPYVRTVLHFDPSALERSLQPFPDYRRFFAHLWQGALDGQAFDLSDRIDYIGGLCDAFDGTGAGRTDARGREEETLLLLQWLACIRSRLEERGEAYPEPRRLRYSEMIMQWLEERYAEPFQLERLARDLHLSKSYISRVFRQETGSRITDYLTARRIKEAGRLLQTTDLSVERIGALVGLPNASYFIRQFKAIVGVTPLKYRNSV